MPAFKQEQKLKAQIADLHVDIKRKIENDLATLKTNYQAEYSAAYNSAQLEYQASVGPIITAFLDGNPEISNSENNESLIPSNLIEPFNFSF